MVNSAFDNIFNMFSSERKKQEVSDEYSSLKETSTYKLFKMKSGNFKIITCDHFEVFATSNEHEAKSKFIELTLGKKNDFKI